MKMKVINLENLAARHESFIFIGIAMVIATLIKLFGIYQISSDWFWFIGGIGLIVEGSIMLKKQRKFDRKYKIIERDSNEIS